MQNNYSNYKNEEIAKKEKLHQQRELMKAELLKQVNAKNANNRDKKEKDRQLTQEQIDMIERKLMEDE